MFKHMMDSGRFDELILACASDIQNNSLSEPHTTLNIVGETQEITAIHVEAANARAIAETSRTLDETANDPGMGATSEEMTMGELAVLAEMV